MNKTDAQLKQEIEEELRWDPKVNAAQIEVRVDGGSISLTGSVDTHGEKWAAADAARRVNGVRMVEHDLSVKLLGESIRKDSDIAIAIRNTFLLDLLARRRYGPRNLPEKKHADRSQRPAAGRCPPTTQ